MVRQGAERDEIARLRREKPARRRAGERTDDGAGARIAGLASSTLMGLFIASLFLPMEIRIGARLTPYTVMLILTILPAAYHILVTDRTNRFTIVDTFMVLYALWIAIAIYYHYGPSRAVFIVNQTITLLGGYVLGRALIRSPDDYRLYFKYYFYGLLIFLPFAIFELFTRTLFLNDLIAHVFDTYGRAGNEPRLGLNRVQGFTPHSITFGLFCLVGVSNMFYIHHDHFRRRSFRTGVVAFMTFISLSSAPNIGMILQGVLIFWDKVSKFIPLRWVVAALLIGTFVTMVQLTVENGMIGLVIENLAFNEQTGWGRTEIIQYASAEVARHPFFGIGLGDWTRPWWRPVSVDNFWLLTAMRYGAPSLIFLALALGIQAVILMTLPALSEEAAAMRTGYLIAWASIVFVLGTVHIWDAVAVFIMSYAGAGAWFYTTDTVRDAKANARLTEPQRSRDAAAVGAGLRKSSGDAGPSLPYTRGAPSRRARATTGRKRQ